MSTLLQDRHQAARPQPENISRRDVLKGGLSLAALLAAGCTPGGDERSGNGATRRVKDVFGSVEVPADPRRVVTLDDQVLGTLLALGFPSGRIVGWARGETPLENYEYMADLADLGKFENLGGAFDDPNIEAIVAAKPDLIMMVGMDGEEFYTPIFRKLRETGVSVFGAFNGYLTMDEYMRLLTDVGVAINRSDEASRLEDGFRASVTDLKNRLTAEGPLPSAAFLRVFPGEGNMYNAVMPLLDALGLPGNRATPKEFTRDVSAEQLGLFNEDVLFVGDGADEAATRAALEANPLWAGLPSVRSGRAIFVSDMTWGVGYSMPALESMLGDIERALIPE
jgi:iron complex transport system substrate-binding protein